MAPGRTSRIQGPRALSHQTGSGKRTREESGYPLINKAATVFRVLPDLGPGAFSWSVLPFRPPQTP